MAKIKLTKICENFLVYGSTQFWGKPKKAPTGKAKKGPTRYHFADMPGEFSIELSWEDIRRIAEEEIGFEILVQS